MQMEMVNDAVIMHLGLLLVAAAMYCVNMIHGVAQVDFNYGLHPRRLELPMPMMLIAMD
jgi:hypothetical protein